MSDYARELIGLNSLEEGLTGAGEVIGVIDSGLDREHPDFADRVRFLEPGVAGGETDDHIGHGTHVAGTAAGSGTASKGQVLGMAPEAELAVVGISGEKGLCLPPDLGDLLSQAADQGAKVINLSWDTPLASVYDNGSKAVDHFAREHPDVLVVVAAGNEAQAPKGYPLLYSVGTPATAKNALTVGACSSSRPEIADTWAAYNQSKFPAAPTAEGTVAGDPEKIAAFSSRGPTDFQSVKPDLVAPGTAILAPRASKAPARAFWREHAEFDNRYAFMNGTSMAAPVASGAAAVVRQHLRQSRGAEPSAALVKAAMVAGVEPLPWGRLEEEAEDFGYPDFDQGFGRLNVAGVLPGERAPAGRKLWLEDVANQDARALESRSPTGDARKPLRRYRFTIGAGAKLPLRAVLAWTDYDQAAVQNCLSLELQGPGGLRERGNAGHRWQQADSKYVDPKFAAAQIDRRNNLQAIGVEAPAPGQYTLVVFASNTLFPPQGYGLCVLGELETEPEEAQ